MPEFPEKLQRACESTKSLLCVGLDPDPALMPVPASEVFRFNQAIIDATADLVCGYKPNLAFYEALGLDGLKALAQTVDYVRHVSGDLLVIGDAKRGDVGGSAKTYAKSLFQVWGFDATTVNGYGGKDTVLPFLEFGDKGVFIWCRSSNPGAGDLQDLQVQGLDGETTLPLYQQVAIAYRDLSNDGNLGLVVGATYPAELKELRRLCPDMPFLIPGVGAQGGDLGEVVRYGTDGRGRLAIISSSRQIIYASRDKDFPQAARREAVALRDQINDVLSREGKGWS